MNAEAREDIMLDTINDDALAPIDGCECDECAMARLIAKQAQMIKAQDESRAIKDKRIAFLEAQVAALKEEIAAHVKGVA